MNMNEYIEFGLQVPAVVTIVIIDLKDSKEAQLYSCFSRAYTAGKDEAFAAAASRLSEIAPKVRLWIVRLHSELTRAHASEPHKLRVS